MKVQMWAKVLLIQDTKMILNSYILEDRREKERTATVNKIPKKGTTTLLHRFRILAHSDFESGHLRKFSWRRQTLKQGLQGGIKFWRWEKRLKNLVTHFKVLFKGGRKRINTAKTLQGILNYSVSAKQDMSRKLILRSNSDF